MVLRRDVDLDEHLEYLCHSAGLQFERQIALVHERGDGNFFGLVQELREIERLCREAALALENPHPSA